VNVNLTEGENLTEWAYCPNPAACPGGFLNASAAPGQAIEVVNPMCLPGYTGLGRYDSTMR
ncbi:unnamed protein product, partial [Symbiodinium pilosum]